jgi:hypothetical protein
MENLWQQSDSTPEISLQKWGSLRQIYEKFVRVGDKTSRNYF